LIKYVNFDKDDLISSDSYNEELMLNKFNSYDENIQFLLIKCAIHIAVIGYGNQNYGAIKSDKDNIVSIKDVFDKYDILYNKKIGEKYGKDSLSARRLNRLLRFHIQRFIIESGRPSYLWLKYSDQNKDKISICFPGAEHMIENKEDAKYLYDTYKKLDSLIGAKFCERLKRVYIARKLYEPQDFSNNNL